MSAVHSAPIIYADIITVKGCMAAGDSSAVQKSGFRPVRIHDLDGQAEAQKPLPDVMLPSDFRQGTTACGDEMADSGLEGGHF